MDARIGTTISSSNRILAMRLLPCQAGRCAKNPSASSAAVIQWVDPSCLVMFFTATVREWTASSFNALTVAGIDFRGLGSKEL